MDTETPSCPLLTSARHQTDAPANSVSPTLPAVVEHGSLEFPIELPNVERRFHIVPDLRVNSVSPTQSLPDLLVPSSLTDTQRDTPNMPNEEVKVDFESPSAKFSMKTIKLKWKELISCITPPSEFRTLRNGTRTNLTEQEPMIQIWIKVKKDATPTIFNLEARLFTSMKLDVPSSIPTGKLFYLTKDFAQNLIDKMMVEMEEGEKTKTKQEATVSSQIQEGHVRKSVRVPAKRRLSPSCKIPTKTIAKKESIENHKPLTNLVTFPSLIADIEQQLKNRSSNTVVTLFSVRSFIEPLIQPVAPSKKKPVAKHRL